MKTRQGFVSNSSSSSFCIYGAEFDDIQNQAGGHIVESMKKDYIAEELKGNAEEFDEDDFDSYLYDNFSDVIYTELEKVGLEYHRPYCGDTAYVGRSLTECKDDQTMGDFKRETAELIKKTLGVTPNLSYQEAAWHD